jgi:uncharacterized repeat protein (TIGR03803 family)
VGGGTVFKVTPNGTLTTLTSFYGEFYGYEAPGGLFQDSAGNFYGVTSAGGGPLDGGFGAVFQETPAGAISLLFVFDREDGQSPVGPVVKAADGKLYGTALKGAKSLGSVFEITPDSANPTQGLTELLAFDAADGASPYAALVETSKGILYGSTAQGGANGIGTIFQIVSGVVTTLHNFDGSDGASPFGALIEGSDGNLYGTTESGGANGYGGTVFKLTPDGTLTTLHNFFGIDGEAPFGALVEGSDGNLYGTTEYGGANGYGTIFQLTPGSTLTTLHSFDSTDGALPNAGLVQGTDGKFYGTTYAGGANNVGAVFSLSVGLGPLVKPLPHAAAVGAPVSILGTNLTGATAVSFNGIAAPFTVVSATQISTAVPAGAATGQIQVTTPAGVLSGFFVVVE